MLKYPIDNLKGKDTPGPYLLIQTEKLKNVLSSYVNPRATKIINNNKKSNNLEICNLKIKLKMQQELNNHKINASNNNINSKIKENGSKSKSQ